MNDPKILDRWSRCAAFMAGKCDEIGWDDDADDMRDVAAFLHRVAQDHRNRIAMRQERTVDQKIHPANPLPDLAWLYKQQGFTSGGVKTQHRHWRAYEIAFGVPYRRCDAPIPASVAAGALMHAMPNMSDDLWQDLDRIANDGHG